jgi:hypothetical protein
LPLQLPLVINLLKAGVARQRGRYLRVVGMEKCLLRGSWLSRTSQNSRRGKVQAYSTRGAGPMIDSGAVWHRSKSGLRRKVIRVLLLAPLLLLTPPVHARGVGGGDATDGECRQGPSLPRTRMPPGPIPASRSAASPRAPCLALRGGVSKYYNVSAPPKRGSSCRLMLRLSCCARHNASSPSLPLPCTLHRRDSRSSPERDADSRSSFFVNRWHLYRA